MLKEEIVMKFYERAVRDLTQAIKDIEDPSKKYLINCNENEKHACIREISLLCNILEIDYPEIYIEAMGE
jgi:hypothetical protein